MKKILIVLLVLMCATGIGVGGIRIKNELRNAHENIRKYEVQIEELQTEISTLDLMITDLYNENTYFKDQNVELTQKNEDSNSTAKKYVNMYFEKCEQIRLIEDIVNENDTLLDDFTVECFFRRQGIRLINLHLEDEAWDKASNQLILMHENAFYLIEKGADMKEVKVYISKVVDTINGILEEVGSEKRLEEIDSLYKLNQCLYENQYTDWEKVLTTATR